MQSRSRRSAHGSPITCLIDAPFELQYLDFEFEHEWLGFEIDTEQGRSRPDLVCLGRGKEDVRSPFADREALRRHIARRRRPLPNPIRRSRVHNAPACRVEEHRRWQGASAIFRHPAIAALGHA